MSATRSPTRVGNRDRRAFDAPYFVRQPDAFRSVLGIPCRRHHVPPGDPCWWTPIGGRGLCGSRIRARFGQ